MNTYHTNPTIERALKILSAMYAVLKNRNVTFLTIGDLLAEHVGMVTDNERLYLFNHRYSDRLEIIKIMVPGICEDEQTVAFQTYRNFLIEEQISHYWYLETSMTSEWHRAFFERALPGLTSVEFEYICEKTSVSLAA